MSMTDIADKHSGYQPVARFWLAGNPCLETP